MILKTFSFKSHDVTELAPFLLMFSTTQQLIKINIKESEGKI